VPQKPVDQLTKLERLREIVALQRLRAREGMQGAHRTDLTFLRDRRATGSLQYAFKDSAPNSWEAMIDFYVANALEEYDKLATSGYPGNAKLFQQLVREKGLQNIVTYRLERRKVGAA